jgi:hypothetical protein
MQYIYPESHRGEQQIYACTLFCTLGVEGVEQSKSGNCDTALSSIQLFS